MEKLEHRGSVGPASSPEDGSSMLDESIRKQEEALFGKTPAISVGSESNNPLLRFFGEKLGAKFIPATAAISLIAGACGDGNSGVDVDFITQEPGQTIVIGNTKEATNTSESNTPTPDSTQTGKGDGATSTPRTFETSTPIAEPTEEPLPIYERENYPYELAFHNVYEGQEVTIVLGAEQSAYNRPDDNICSKIGNFSNEKSPCPPIRRFELSDEYLREYAPDRFPNGMSQEEMIQRMNDFELSLIVWNMNVKSATKDMTIDKLKAMIHNGTAPEFVQSFADGSSLSWSLNKKGKYEVHYIALDKAPIGESNVKTISVGDVVKYSKLDNARIMGIWQWESFLQNYKEPPGHTATIGPIASIAESNIMIHYDLFPAGNVTLAELAGGNAMIEGVDRLGIVVVSK